MPKRIVILSGNVGAGKTTLADKLVQRFDVTRLKTREFLKKRGARIPQERGALQAFGERLDKRTKGAWVCEDLLEAVKPLTEDAVVVLDSVRMRGQVDSIRRAYGQRVVHVHLDATIDVLRDRYSHRKPDDIRELPSYDAVQVNRTEKKVHTLRQIADVVIQTDRCTEQDVLIRVASHIGLFGRDHLRLVDVLVGGQYGSEGKGQVAAYLAPEYDLLIRGGGPNAGHKVWEEPRPYAFHQLPSGTRRCEAQLMIAAGAVINVKTLLKEIADCQVDPERLFIDPQAMIITEADIKQEKDLVARIGSTGQGVGAATARRILRGAGGKQVLLAKDFKELRPFIRPGREVLEDTFHKLRRVLLEGTQGTGLSLYHGYYPHVTSRDTTVAGSLAEAGISPNRVKKVIMVCRTYPIRVQDGNRGTSGPMSQELDWKEIARRSGYAETDLRGAEMTTTTHKQRRVAEFDWNLLRTAATLNAPTDIALTFVDYISCDNTQAMRFEQLTPETIQFIEEVERVASAPVTLVSTGFNLRSVIDRRMW